MSCKTITYQANEQEDCVSRTETKCEGCDEEFLIENCKNEADALAAAAIWAAKHKCQI